MACLFSILLHCPHLIRPGVVWRRAHTSPTLPKDNVMLKTRLSQYQLTRSPFHTNQTLLLHLYACFETPLICLPPMSPMCPCAAPQQVYKC
ncbi:hypothetical protein QBC36DRAFT_329547 [Triangularia setosa]|uniref:Secreted protein n=1 Tax=Triangularia setosa TaxID=2587417 RepID=A0AAN7A8I4_9PEZI|nr:hypothetical protein QBC36DRAFT_329547 [Podospora setosa]